MMWQPILAISDSKLNWEVVEGGKEKVWEWREETMWEDEGICEVGDEEEEGKKEEEEEEEENEEGGKGQY